MARRRFHYHPYCALAFIMVFRLTASEHRGQVKFGGLPIPGATVTATQANERLNAITNDQGIYSFPSMSDGVWTIQVEMLCFVPIKREVVIGPNAPNTEWDLRLLPVDKMNVAPPGGMSAAT